MAPEPPELCAIEGDDADAVSHRELRRLVLWAMRNHIQPLKDVVGQAMIAAKVIAIFLPIMTGLLGVIWFDLSGKLRHFDAMQDAMAQRLSKIEGERHVRRSEIDRRLEQLESRKGR